MSASSGHWLRPHLGLLVLPLLIAACALEDSGMYDGIESNGGDPGTPYTRGGTGGTALGGTGPTGGTGGTMDSLCANGVLDGDEDCIPHAGTPQICVDCHIDTTRLAQVTGTATPPQYIDPDGHLHYYYAVQPQSFDEAEATCEAAGAHLVTLRDAAEVSIVEELLQIPGEGWVGGREQGTVAFPMPTWVTGEAWGYLPAGGYVKDTPGHDCIAFQVSLQRLVDRDCSIASRAVCEWEAVDP